MNESLLYKPSVFIGSSTEGLDFARAVRGVLSPDAEITVWNEGFFELGRTFIESLVNNVERFDFAILVMTPDDLRVRGGQEELQPRDNVIFELGLFMGSLGRARTFVVQQRRGDLKLPTDLSGVTTAMYDWPRDDNSKNNAVGQACDMIRDAIRQLGISDQKAKREIRAVAKEQQEQKSVIEQQQTYLDVFFVLLTDRLSPPEKFHLRALARGGERYTGRPELRNELLHLKRLGLIEEVPGQKIGDIFDGKVVDPGAFIKLTDSGKKFIVALDKIESQ